MRITGAGCIGSTTPTAKESGSYSSIDPFKQVVPQARQMRANTARAPKGINAQAVANAQILESKKSDIRYKNGRTLRASASRLLADARRKELEHSAILSDNMVAAGQTLPDARKHSPLHTYVYHAQVYGRLVPIEPERKHSETARKALRRIKAELVAGTFPYRKEHLA
jgi:hypothetical protein